MAASSSNFIVQALTGEPVTMYGDGSQTRSFCYVEDEVEGIYQLFLNRGDAEPTNIGNPVEYTVKQLAEIVVELTRISIRQLLTNRCPTDDPKLRLPRHHPCPPRTGLGTASTGAGGDCQDN